MATRVFLTVDTELMWRHHAAGLDAETIFARSIEPARVGVSWQLARLADHGLKATFFVDPMPALIYGIDVVKRMVAPVLEAGQEVQLHLHPGWSGASRDDRRADAPSDLIDYGYDEQLELIAGAARMLEAAGVPEPLAFRAGNYSASDDTLLALADLGFAYDSSHNGAHHPWPSAISLPPRQVAPVAHLGVVEIPVSVIEDRAGHLRTFQICALSAAEMRDALDHAEREGHQAVTIVSHGFELANRRGTRPNAIHVRRFEALCALLGERRETLVTTHFADRPELALGRADAPLGPNALRTRLRQAQQLWSNLVEERAA
ncbi:MAG: polysaccharide deacetylase [Pseudomonadota bacterium]